MTDLWNSWEVKPPPVCTVKCVLHFKEINELKGVLMDMLQTLRNVGFLNREAAFISRYLYKNKRIFRHDKGLQYIVKINQCLKRYLKLNLSEVVNTFKQSVPGKLQQGVTHAYLPTRQMLKWILLRLQAFSQIFARLTGIAKEAGVWIFGKINLGWALNLSFLIFSSVARILACSKFLVAKSIEWYNSLYKCLPNFVETAEFLTGYKFPTDLKKWLGDVDLSPLKKKTAIDKVFELIDLVMGDEEEEDGDDDEVKIVGESLMKSFFKERCAQEDSEEVVIEEERIQRKRKKPSAASVSEDLGVPVEEEEVVAVLQKRPKAERKKQKLGGIKKQKKATRMMQQF